MIVTYDYRLVVLSILVSMLAAHAGLLIFSRHYSARLSYKTIISIGAFILGGGIWTMHFIGMLALHMPMPINYAVLPTLISALVAIILTALGLYAVSSGHLNKSALPVGALLMGSGISSMHYIGMKALAQVCRVDYTVPGIDVSTALGIIASGLALKLAFSGPKKKRHIFSAAVALGLAISSLHYTAMYYTQFSLFNAITPIPRPTLSTTYLACIVAVTTFLVVNIFLLINLPNKKLADLNPVTERKNDIGKPKDYVSLVVSSKGVNEYVNMNQILYVKAERHYTKVGFINDKEEFVQKLCNDNISKLEKKLKAFDFLRCHRSYLINLVYINKVSRMKDGGKAFLKNDSTPSIPISRSAFSNFIKELDRINYVN